MVETEMRIGQVLGVEIRPEDLTKPPTYLVPAFTPPVLTQWRFLLYFVRVEGSLQADLCTLKLQIFGKPYQVDVRPFPERELRLAKLFYVFAASPLEVQRTCTLEELTMEVWVGQKRLGRGSCSPFSLFSFSNPEITNLVQDFRIDMMNQGRVGKMLIYAGFTCDKQVRSQELKTTLQKYHQVYLPTSSYMTPDLLPESWMELFGKELRHDESQVFKHIEECNPSYTPSLKLNEMVVNPLGSMQVLHNKVNLNPLFKGERPSVPPQPPSQSTHALHCIPQSSRTIKTARSVQRRRPHRRTFTNAPGSTTWNERQLQAHESKQAEQDLREFLNKKALAGL